MKKHSTLNIAATILIIASIVLFLPALFLWGWFTLFIFAIPLILSILSIRFKTNAWGIVLLIISVLKIIFFVIILCFFTWLDNELGIDKRQTPADVQMIEHFKLNETQFEELRSMIEKDTLSHYPLFAQEKRDSVPLSISTERTIAYDALMKEIQIESIKHYWWRKNSIQFVHFEQGDATWGIEKGYEYVFDRANREEKNKVFTEKELRKFATENKLNNCTFYKKINEHWNLYIEYDR